MWKWSFLHSFALWILFPSMLLWSFSIQMPLHQSTFTVFFLTSSILHHKLSSVHSLLCCKAALHWKKMPWLQDRWPESEQWILFSNWLPPSRSVGNFWPQSCEKLKFCWKLYCDQIIVPKAIIIPPSISFCFGGRSDRSIIALNFELHKFLLPWVLLFIVAAVWHRHRNVRFKYPVCNNPSPIG